MIHKIMRPSRAAQWTRAKIDSLTTPEVKQLRANAERLSESEITALCDDVLGKRPRGGGPRSVSAARSKKSSAP